MNGSLLCSVGFFGLLSLSLCQYSPAQSPGVLMDRLHLAAEATTLDFPDSAPFHLKLSVEILPQYGRSADKGTVEIWWNAPREQRIVYDLSQYHATVVYTPNGMFRTADAGSSPYIVNHLLGQVVHPVTDKINSSDVKLELVKQPFGKAELDCIVLTPASSKSLDISRTTYCFDDRSRLRITLATPDQYNLRQTLGTLGTRIVPLSLEYTFLHKVVARAHVETLQSQKDAYLEASETTTLVPVPAPPKSLPDQALNGHLLHRQDPVYPEGARQRRVFGTVLLNAIVGVDGKVKHLSLIGSPDDSLTASAINAVNQWTYQPYLVNGVPTEVDTTITVNYTLNAH